MIARGRDVVSRLYGALSCDEWIGVSEIPASVGNFFPTPYDYSNEKEDKRNKTSKLKLLEADRQRQLYRNREPEPDPPPFVQVANHVCQLHHDAARPTDGIAVCVTELEIG